MNVITLSRANGSWIAQHSGPHAAQIIDLFGTDTLPTAFTDLANPADVLAHIQARNPGVTVQLDRVTALKLESTSGAMRDGLKAAREANRCAECGGNVNLWPQSPIGRCTVAGHYLPL